MFIQTKAARISRVVYNRLSKLLKKEGCFDKLTVEIGCTDRSGFVTLALHIDYYPTQYITLSIEEGRWAARQMDRTQHLMDFDADLNQIFGDCIDSWFSAEIPF